MDANKVPNDVVIETAHVHPDDEPTPATPADDVQAQEPDESVEGHVAHRCC